MQISSGGDSIDLYFMEEIVWIFQFMLCEYWQIWQHLAITLSISDCVHMRLSLNDLLSQF